MGDLDFSGYVSNLSKRLTFDEMKPVFKLLGDDPSDYENLDKKQEIENEIFIDETIKNELLSDINLKLN